MRNNKILVIVGGGKKHLASFIREGKKLGCKIKTASFSELEYRTGKGNPVLNIGGDDLASFSLIYIRLVGKRFEDVALLADYARQKKIIIVDRIYEKSLYIRLPLAKSLETKLLVQAGVPVPKSYFANLTKIKENGPEIFGFPFVIKGTVGKQGHAVWSPRNESELEELVEELHDYQKEKGGRFLAQEFIKASQRNRVLVIGGKAVAAITRPTRWRKRFTEKIGGRYPEGRKEGLLPVPKDDAKLAIAAAKALSIDIAGVDIIREDATGKPYILEVNSAPRWKAIKRDTGVNVEKEILKFLASL
jgi:ribosomal protein S6--L-glutamate ligase